MQCSTALARHTQMLLGALCACVGKLLQWVQYPNKRGHSQNTKRLNTYLESCWHLC